MDTAKIDNALKPILRKIADPEIPVLSIMDMGVVRSAIIIGKKARIKITPTYSGCPAMDVIGDEITNAIDAAGYNTSVELALHPSWTTDWITPEGRKALQEYGIAAPLQPDADKAVLLQGKKMVKCPQCGSHKTKMVSQFGSTACKALFKCENCEEPFDYFKCLK